MFSIMRTGYAMIIVIAVSLMSTVPGSTQTFNIADTYVGADFFNSFTWNTFDDPTHGRVNYVDMATAQQTNLSYASGDTFVMRADDVNIIPPSARGRNSVRLTSQTAYEDSILVIDLSHMPEGCATWPAFWTVSQAGPWPQGGEIDIIEGVNLDAQNLASLHTTSQCTMPQVRNETGSIVSTNCDASVNNNQGCGVSFSKSGSYGAPLNSMGGGWYVMQRTQADGVFVWFWSRNDNSVPVTVKSGDTSLSPDDSWGLPEARFPSTASCDFSSHFDAHQIIFDLTFCGDWAGSVYSSSGCGSQSCSDYVDNNPQAFSDAYWQINALRVYTP